MNIYKQAAISRVRFSSHTPAGLLTTEDLFDLSLTTLNTMTKAVNRELKDAQEESFIDTKSDATSLLELKFEILKDVIATKKEVLDAKEKAAENRKRKQQLLTLLNQKENEQLSAKSIEEIRAELEKLN
jgi:hypothetical protein